jgi:hypothetical protein
MTIKRTFILGSTGGLFLGAILFSAGMWLQPTSAFMPIISFLTWPVTSLYMWLLVSTHGQTGAGILSFMTTVLIFWAVIGALAGVCYRKVMSWRHISHAA